MLRNSGRTPQVKPSKTSDYMKNLSSLLLLVSLWAATAVAQPVPDRDFVRVGEVQFRRPCTASFVLTNKESKPCRIERIEPSCGCVQSRVSSYRIPAGGSATIYLTYDARLLGVFYKEVAVYFEGRPEPLWLTMEGRVVKEPMQVDCDLPVDMGNVRLSTDNVEFDYVGVGERPVAQIEVVNMERSNYKPQLMQLPPYLKADFVPEILRGGQRGVILLTLDSSQFSDHGLFQTSVYLSRYPNDLAGKDNEIRVSAVLCPSVRGLTAEQLAQAPVMRLSQESVTLVNTGKKKLKGEIEITNDGQSPLHFSRFQVFNPGVEAVLDDSELLPGKSMKLKFTVKPALVKTSKADPRILLITDDPRRPVKIINISLK